MTVDHESRHALGGPGVQTHKAGDSSIGNPHFGAGQLPIDVPEPAITVSKLGDVREKNLLATAFIIAPSVGIVGFVIEFFEMDRARLSVRRPPIMGQSLVEFDAPG